MSENAIPYVEQEPTREQALEDVFDAALGFAEQIRSRGPVMDRSVIDTLLEAVDACNDFPRVCCDEPELFRPEDNDVLKWGDFKICENCLSIVTPEGKIFMRGPKP